MANTLTTESGDILVSETVAGIAEASTLNDINVVTINKETFDTNPESRGWTIGAAWAWSSGNENMEIV